MMSGRFQHGGGAVVLLVVILFTIFICYILFGS